MPGKMFSNAQKAKVRDSNLIGVAPECPDADLVDTPLSVPMGIKLLNLLPLVIPMQLQSYHCAAYRGLDVDQPLNLAKSDPVV